MKGALFSVAVMVFLFWGCTGAIGSTSIQELNTHPENYTNMTVKVVGTTQIDSRGFWKVTDEQGYSILVKLYPELGRTLYNRYKISVRGNLSAVRVCDCERATTDYGHGGFSNMWEGVSGSNLENRPVEDCLPEGAEATDAGILRCMTGTTRVFYYLQATEPYTVLDDDSSK